MMYLVSICIICPSCQMRRPLGNRILGCSADLLFLFETFLSIIPFLFKILPTVLSETTNPSLFKMAASLCFDQAGYCFLNCTVLAMIGQGVTGSLDRFGFLEDSFNPSSPNFLILFCHRNSVILPIPKCRAVSDELFP